jgi:DNA-binding transcriptional regulator YiaG
MGFSEKIKYVREKLSMSQEDLARALNVSFATINRWENAKTKPIKIAQAAFDSFCESHGINFNDGKEKKKNG